MIQLFFDKTDERWGEKRPSHRELYSNFGCGKLHHFRPAGLVFGFWDDVQKFIALKSASLSAQMHLDNHKTYKICKEYTCFPSKEKHGKAGFPTTPTPSSETEITPSCAPPLEDHWEDRPATDFFLLGS